MTNLAILDKPAMLAPFSQEAEEAVLGSVISDGDAYHAVALYLKPDDFFILRNSYIWAAFKRLADRRTPFDFVTLTNELKAMNRYEAVGGAGYLIHLSNVVATSAHADVYGRLVQRAAVRRRMLVCADEFKVLAMDEDLPLETVLADAERHFISVRDTSLEDDNEPLSDILQRLMSDVEARMSDAAKLAGITTGFRDLDELTGGLHTPDLTIIAARPAMGKTSLLLNVAMNAARHGAHVGIASQEMDRNQIVQRLAAMESGVNSHKIRLGRLTDDEWGRFVKACGELSKLPIFVDDANRLTPTMLRTKCLRWRNHHGLDLLMVDYLQILSSGGMFKGSERVAEVGYFARELKQLARELRIPVVAAAQLSRSLESRNDKRPLLSDLRESGEIEQEADLVHFIYRDAVYNPETDNPGGAEVITAKHRNGATGTTTLYFDRTTTRFSSAHTRIVNLRDLTGDNHD